MITVSFQKQLERSGRALISDEQSGERDARKKRGAGAERGSGDRGTGIERGAEVQ